MRNNKSKSTLFGIASSILSDIENDTRLKNALIEQGTRKECRFTIIINRNEKECQVHIDHATIVNSISKRIMESNVELEKIMNELGLKQKQDYEL